MKRAGYWDDGRFGRPSRVLVVLVLGVSLSALSSLNAQSLTWIGNPIGSLGNPTWAYDVSWDGQFVVGTRGLDIPPSNVAFRWNKQTGIVNLGFLQCCAGSGAYGVSADGNVVVGWSYGGDGDDRRAFRWAQGTGMVDLGALPGGNESWAYDVSEDGTWIVGWAHNESGRRNAVRWYWSLPPPLIELLPAPTTESVAYGVSADGRVAVGMRLDRGIRRALCWEQTNAGWNVHHLGTLGGSESEALGISPDGRIVVGWAHNPSNQRHAFIWGVGNPLPVDDLGTLPGDSESWANDVSNRNWLMYSTVVGASSDGYRQRAVRWRYPLQSVPEDLNEVYACLLTDGSRLEEATAISPDGRYIVGWGYDASRGFQAGFLLDTGCSSHNGDVNDDGCVDDADLLAVLFAFGRSGLCLGRVDVNCDRRVDDADLLIVLFNFGSGC